MIIKERKNWARMLIIWQGSVLPKIAPRLLLLTVFSMLIYLFHGSFFSYKITLNPSPFTLIGVALAIFLGFCNTAAYDRYWEGRKLWGALVIDTRSFVRQILTFVEANPQRGIEPKTAVFQTIAYTYALKHQLRDTDAMPDLERLLSAEECSQIQNLSFKPVMILKMMASFLDNAQRSGQIDTITKMGIDQNIDKLSGIIGGCERIANTPIPFPYHILLHRTVYIYCLLLPFGLVDTIGWMTPIMVTFIGYTFMALDAIVDEIADPFGTEPNDLALNSLCATVEHSILEMAELPVPEKIKSGNNYCID
ncbi:bestrophin family protein [Mangrovibacterium lignilyticum]|uniref:bestrophin family protein n=1 Tax=Mangrovibacterium lignilyticum TaxID=2668052 RepID=UPI0013D04284|nr:bestrophin family ion channel [Mangrovibacterium lignilyticum]